MQPLIEYRTRIAGVRTRALELEGTGPPLVLFHGYADSADTWRTMLDRLARLERRAIAIDMPGFGQCDRLARDETILAQHDRLGAALVRQVAQEHGEDVVVVGNSLGGCLTLRLGQDPTLPIRGLMPLAPAGFDHAGWFRVLEGDRFVRTLLTVPMPTAVFRRILAEGYRQIAFGDPGAQPGPVPAVFASHFTSRRDVRRYLATGRRLLPELTTPFELERITAPVTLVWGDRDRLVTHKGARRLLEALPETRFELLRGVGHLPQIEAVDRVMELLLELAPAPVRARRR